MIPQIRIAITTLFILTINAGYANETEQEENTQLDRIEFGNSYVMGQSIQSGAVYLTNRKRNEIKSMLNLRESYRKEILKGYTASEKQIEPIEK